MARRWHHEVNAEWLKARQQVLTATDVANLMPEYKRYLKAGSPDIPTPGFSALWCKKHSDVYLDTSSTDAAARGHIMEPYAIDSWNKQASPMFHHWDDCVIRWNMFGFSPDALTIAQGGRGPEIDIDHNPLNPLEAMEVKCYGPEQHMKAYVKDRMDKDELMQIAMAFVVLDSLEKVRLVWFCPGAPVSMFTEEYTRDDLHDQIRWILEIGEVYMKCDNYWKNQLKNNSNQMTAMYTEQEIYMDYVAEMAANNGFMLK